MRKLPLLIGAAAAAVAVRRSDRRPGALADGPRQPVASAAGQVPLPPPADSADGAPHREVDLTDEGQRASAPTDIPSRGWKAIAKRTLAEVKADQVPMMAAAVAFAGLLALFPAMIAAISIYGLVTDPAAAASAAGELTSALPADAASLIGDQLRAVADAEPAALGLALLISVLAALWSASGGVGMLLDALNTAYDEEEDRGFVRRKALALGLTLGAIIFLAAAVTLIAVVPPLVDGIGLGVVGTIAAQVVRWLLLAALIAVALAVLYRYAPNRADAKWRWLSPGAAVASLLWLLGSLAFSVFVDNFGSYNETYGAVAGVIVLMLWLQISALVVLLGAELNAETERQTAVDTTTGAPRPMGDRGAEPADEPPPAHRGADTAAATPEGVGARPAARD